MKRILFSLAVLLVCLPVSSQEAGSDGNHAVLSIVPRVEYNPYFYGGTSVEHTFGASSLYTFFDGNITESLSFSISNHWLNAYTKELYQNTFKSNSFNWVDWIYLDYAISGFNFTVGKQCTYIGGFGNYDYDVNVFSDMSSSVWNYYPSYQWGASVTYTLPSENHTFGIQMLTSPYGERPFASGLFTYACKWEGTFGPFSTLWQFTASQNELKKFATTLTLGQKLEFEKIRAELDYYSNLGIDSFFCPKHAIRASVNYRPIYNVEIIASGNWEARESAVEGSKAGGGFCFYIPDKSGEDFCRFHLNGGYWFGAESAYANVGVTFFLPLHIY